MLDRGCLFASNAYIASVKKYNKSTNFVILFYFILFINVLLVCKISM